ncbi:MAG: hypothetical protein UT32_C0014G0011 [Parcubacteria group bacterium GW2011_GWC2_39_14]|nr:MAG: hypothetical protein UT32_C0014G0011 [Parcubacteria group bacterium GW2011_GWC2_39_14]KKR54459.1 MAG: hypothetical protein UT91_C0015G0011 [Parcubacteria group bacterium GW2011_GWA2_40_23]
MTRMLLSAVFEFIYLVTNKSFYNEVTNYFLRIRQIIMMLRIIIQ